MKFFAERERLILLLLAAVISSCANNTSENTREATSDSITIITKVDSSTNKPDSLNAGWINNFREFRDAIYRDDLPKVKSFFNFPVLNYGNEIWSVVLTDSTQVFHAAQSDALIPFTENDFNKYYKKLFNKEFKNAILKVKSDELFKTGQSFNESINLDSVTTYTMIASVDKEERTLHLVLLYDTEYKDEDGNTEDGGESSIGYTFIIKNDGRLIFKEIRIAG